LIARKYRISHRFQQGFLFVTFYWGIHFCSGRGTWSPVSGAVLSKCELKKQSIFFSLTAARICPSSVGGGRVYRDKILP
jgi:hypothetical protein